MMSLASHGLSRVFATNSNCKVNEKKKERDEDLHGLDGKGKRQPRHQK